MCFMIYSGRARTREMRFSQEQSFRVIRSTVQWLVLLFTAAFGFEEFTCAQSIRPGMGSIPYADAVGTGVTFRVWAPDATTVAVPGSFNGWNTTANFLVKEGSSGLWSADISIARPNDQYKYF